MAIGVMSYVWKNSKAKSTKLLLMLALADHADDDGYCWPRIETLAHKIRMSSRSVRRFVQELEQQGELLVIRDHRNNRYIVTMDRSREEIKAVLSMRGIDAR